MAKKKVFQIGNSLTNGLEETISAAHNYRGELRVEVIPIKKIQFDPENPRDLLLTADEINQGLNADKPDYERRLAEFESLKGMAYSIEEQGMLNPILVYKQGENYKLIAGERRTLASIIAGKKDIQAKIFDKKPTELKLGMLQWIENIQREDLSLWERLRNLEKIFNAFAVENQTTLSALSLSEMSKIIGCSRTQAMSYKAALLVDEKVKSLIMANKLTNLEKVALISGLISPDLRQKAIDACLDGATIEELRTFSVMDKAPRSVNKPIIPSTSSTRGRTPTRVNLGSTANIKAVKLLVNSVLGQDLLHHLKPFFSQVDWEDYKSASDGFRQLLLKLEEVVD
jgi:ParB family chromosome partitioning protein